MTWFKGAVVPATVGLIMIPLITYLLAPPEMKSSPEAPIVAAARLKEMGPPSRNEKITMGVLTVRWQLTPLFVRTLFPLVGNL